MNHLRFGLVAVLALAFAGPLPAAAQVSRPPAGTAAKLGPTDFLNAALAVVSSIDRYEMGLIWDTSSPIMKAGIPKDRFVSNTAQKRAVLGGVAARDWTAIMRVVIDEKGGALPPGRYMSVRFRTSSRNGTSVDEVVSFHLDGDGQWKLAGYSII